MEGPPPFHVHHLCELLSKLRPRTVRSSISKLFSLLFLVILWSRKPKNCRPLIRDLLTTDLTRFSGSRRFVTMATSLLSSLSPLPLIFLIQSMCIGVDSICSSSFAINWRSQWSLGKVAMKDLYDNYIAALHSKQDKSIVYICPPTPDASAY